MKRLHNTLTIWFLAVALSWTGLAKADTIQVQDNATAAPLMSESSGGVEASTTDSLGGQMPADKDVAKQEVNVKEIVFGHIGNSYEWHITTWGDLHITVPLPVIVYSETTGWHVFLSSRLEENGGVYEGLSIAPEGSRYEGKLVEHDAAGNEVRPWDFSITKVAFALIFNSLLLAIIVLGVARWYRKEENRYVVPGGFVGFMEMFIMMVNDDIIKGCIGPNYKKFAPYLLTAFFFIFINNLMGLIPFFQVELM